jgi:hypothetical protein
LSGPDGRITETPAVEVAILKRSPGGAGFLVPEKTLQVRQGPPGLLFLAGGEPVADQLVHGPRLGRFCVHERERFAHEAVAQPREPPGLLRREAFDVAAERLHEHQLRELCQHSTRARALGR